MVLTPHVRPSNRLSGRLLPLNTPPSIFRYSGGSYNYSETGGPFRLGIQYVQINPSNTDAPQFAQKHYKVVYAWFADDNTILVASFGGYSTATLYYLNQGVVGVVSAPLVTQVDTAVHQGNPSLYQIDSRGAACCARNLILGPSPRRRRKPELGLVKGAQHRLWMGMGADRSTSGLIPKSMPTSSAPFSSYGSARRLGEGPGVRLHSRVGEGSLGVSG